MVISNKKLASKTWGEKLQRYNDILQSEVDYSEPLTLSYGYIHRVQ